MLVEPIFDQIQGLIPRYIVLRGWRARGRSSIGSAPLQNYCVSYWLGFVGEPCRGGS